MRTAMFLVVLCCTTFQYGQHHTNISGTIKERITQLPITNAILRFNGISNEFLTDGNGKFSISVEFSGNYLLQVDAPDFSPKRFELFLKRDPIDLGEVFLEKKVIRDKIDNLISLSDDEFSDDEGLISSSMGLLQSTKDIFLTRAAFDFGQAFFKVRGYDSQRGKVMINGIVMNKLWDGRPQWNNWGGLNDVVRNQEFTRGLNPNPYVFGDILANTNIDIRPSGLRPGVRISSSISNRTYTGRLMTTYNSGLQGNGLSFSFSSSRRWAKSGYVQGTLYDAYSFFGSVEYKLNNENSLVLSAVLAKNRRGRSAAMTEEVFDLMKNKYNPYWGNQNGEMRNSRERMISEPLFILNHFIQSQKLNWTSGIAYQNGITAKSRLNYFDAPNPDPTYYKHLPSYQINSGIGANFTNAEMAKTGFLKHSQIIWDQLYVANSNVQDTSAAYLLSEDVVKEKQFMLASSLDYQVSKHFKLGLGVQFRNSTSESFAEIKDLLGALFSEDKDSFSNTRNDLHGALTKMEGEKIGYNFIMDSKQLNGFGQIEFNGEGWNSFAAASFSNFNMQRNGLFQNERYLESSMGKSEKLSFSSTGLKSGATFHFTGRHSLSVNGALIHRPPSLQNTFINPRENNIVVPKIEKETISTIDLNYFIRLPDLTGRMSAFYTRFHSTTDINFFYTDSGLGSDFVQEVITGLDRLHKGLELGLEYQVSNDVKLSVVGNLGSYAYASDPDVQLYFDTASTEEDLINLEGKVDLGIAQLKGLRLGQGPQTALAIGAAYRSPKYWWTSITTNYLDHNYVNMSTITRTQSFILDPETGEPFPDANQENVSQILKQQKLNEIYLLNLIGGKSWLVNEKYISAFLSVNNLFDSVFPTGGYEQSRNGNFGQMQQDIISGTPLFGPKYWYSYGRTYFLNLAISF